MFYRKLQVLGCICYEDQQSDVLLFTIFVGKILLVCALTLTYSITITRENVVGFGIFMVATFDLVSVFVTCVGAMAEIYSDFKEVLGKINY